MKRIIRISAILLVLAGACAAKLIYNKSRIDANSKPEQTNISIPVTVVEVTSKAMTAGFSVTGSFLANKELTLLSEGQGRVLKVMADAGDVVKEGQVLAEMDDVLIRSQLALAEANLEKATKDLKNFEAMAKSEAVTSQQLQEIRLACLNAEANAVAMRKQMANTKITAPFSGTLTKRYIEKGTLLMPGSPVVDISDVGRLRFLANLGEKEISRISGKVAVKITVDVYQGFEYEGKIKSLGVKADEAKRFPVEIELANDPQHPIRAGMFGVALFGDKDNPEVLIIPRKSITGSLKDPQVFVVENNIAMLKSLVIGRVTDDEVEVFKGLKQGEKVVLTGQINLENRKKVTIVNP
ncbi:MAG: efflux RND transporter periplasmic adaptor subunit [Bacteroidetes bacterium]|nr:efflux RND transporter periplasmic adaptor subunit [Bacteroidota bacterium]